MIERSINVICESQPQEFDGSWECGNRNSTTAAYVGLVIIGVIYFYAQSMIVGFLVFVNFLGTHTHTVDNTFLEQLKHSMSVLKNPVRYTLIITQYLCMLFPTVWLVKRWHSSNVFSYFRCTRVPISEIVLAVVIALCFFPISSMISGFFARQLQIPDFLSEINVQIFTSYSLQELIWLILVVCITPAICEELFFRGFVQRTLERKLGFRSVFIVGVIFGLYHMRPLNLISLSLLGILIGYFYYRSRSVFPGIALHFTNNVLVILSLYKTSDGLPALGQLAFTTTIVGMLCAFSLGGFILWIFHQRTKRNFEPSSIENITHSKSQIE